jgi:methyltransferase
MGPATVILAIVTAERLAELLWAAANTARLRGVGAVEVGAGHYPLLVGLHAAWLGTLWLLAWDRPVSPIFLGLFLVLQVGRAWVLATLKRRWTTRILVVPGEPLVVGGPYRFMRHPNYAVVALEIAVLPLTFGLVWIAALFSVVHALVLWLRIRCEEAALEPLRAPPG